MINVKIEGFDKMMAKLDKMSKDVHEEVQLELNDWADRTALNAIQLVSIQSSDEGYLKNSISPIRGPIGGKLGAGVVASAPYAAYIEFGTRKFAAAYVGSLPTEWAQYAATFKGKGKGTFKDLLNSIIAWCGRKGIDSKAAYPIAKSILIKGIKARPFLYPSVQKTLPLLKQNIKEIVK